MTEVLSSQTRIEAAANRLSAVSGTRVPCAPVRDLIGAHDLAAAYAVQQHLTQERLEGGARVVGRKIGLTSPAVQQQLGVDQPDFGMLFSDMAFNDGDILPWGRLLQPRVEAEIAFVLSADLDIADPSLEQVAEAINHAVAALEICDSRVADWDITFADTVSDNASAGLYALGVQQVSLSNLVPREVEMTMSVLHSDGTSESSTGLGAACLGDPLIAVQWLARQAYAFGQPLRAGQVILSGAMGPMRPVRAGSRVTAEMTGLGSVSIEFGEGNRS